MNGARQCERCGMILEPGEPHEQVGVWLRVSTLVQEEDEQRPSIMRWVRDHRYCVVREYKIHGESAFKGSKKFDRKWAEVIKDFHESVITCLVTWNTKRIDRKLQTIQMIGEVVREHGRIEFISQPHLNDLSTMEIGRAHV